MIRLVLNGLIVLGFAGIIAGALWGIWTSPSYNTGSALAMSGFIVFLVGMVGTGVRVLNEDD